MYDQISEELDDTGVVERLNTPVWMNNTGKLVAKDDDFGCKTTHKITRPGMCLVADDVGVDKNQKGDGNVGVSYSYMSQKNALTPD